MILRVQGGGVDENICMSLAREAMVQTKPQYWQLKMYGICQYDWYIANMPKLYLFYSTL